MTKNINLELCLSLECPRGCRNCYRLCDRLPNRTEYLTIERVAAFLDEARRRTRSGEIAIRRLKLCGGEPTTNPWFDEIYDMCLGFHEQGGCWQLRINTTIPQPRSRFRGGVWNISKLTDKRHMPILWSPADMGIVTKGPCRMARGCGANLDPRGWTPCAAAHALVRLLGRYDVYQWDIPTKMWAADVLCKHCIFSVPKSLEDQLTRPLAEITDADQHATPTMAEGFDELRTEYNTCLCSQVPKLQPALPPVP